MFAKSEMRCQNRQVLAIAYIGIRQHNYYLINIQTVNCVLTSIGQASMDGHLCHMLRKVYKHKERFNSACSVKKCSQKMKLKGR